MEDFRVIYRILKYLQQSMDSVSYTHLTLPTN